MAITRKYINKQQHSYSCGPVAILNVRKWLGCKHTGYRKNIGHFRSFGYSGDGMWPRYLSITLNKMKIKYKRKNNATMTDIEKALDKGCSVVLNYAWHNREDGAHYAFIDKHTVKSVRAWNWSDIHKTPYLSKKQLRKWFRYSNKYYNKRWNEVKPIIWVISRD